MSIETYEALTARFDLYAKLQEGLDDVAAGRTRPWEDVRKELSKQWGLEWNYKIHVSHAAEHDLHSAANYIAHQLQNPLAARRMLANALASIDSLETFPGRFPVIDEPLLASHQLHFVPVQNYLLFYRIDSSTQTVHILRFLYGHSDWQAILRADVLPT